MSKRGSEPNLHGGLALVFSLRPVQARLLLLGAAAALSLLLTSVLERPLEVFEEQLGVAGWTVAPDTTPEQRVSIVAIDEKSVEQLGAWPWPRQTMAQLSEALNGYGVQLQLFDIVFPEARDGDAEFIEALGAGGAVLSQVPVLSSEQAVRSGSMSHPLTGMACSPQAVRATDFVANSAAFAGIPKGHIGLQMGSDGMVRHIPAYVCVDGEPYPALSLSAFITAAGASDWSATRANSDSLLGPDAYLSLNAFPGLTIPVDEQGNLRVSYQRAPEVFQAFSAIDIVNGSIDRELLEDTWVLVGYTAFGLVDIVPTPYNGVAPGVEIQARILTSLLDGEVPFEPKAAPFIQVLMSGLFALLLLGIASTRREKVGVIALALCVVLLPLLALAVHMQALRSSHLWLGWISSASFGVLAAGFLVVHEFTRVRLERNRVLTNLSSYLPESVAHEIAYSLPSSAIEARRQSVTLLSADLRNFSAYSEARLPEESAAILHFFFTKATAIIESNHGRVHEFKGDGLIALWDAASDKAARQAVAAAHEMQQEIQALLPDSAPQGLEPLALGVGIEQGPVLIGSIGAAQRRTHTLLGETVTITLRIQEMTAELAQPILIGSQAARQLQGEALQSQGSYLLNGLRTPHTLYAPAPSGTKPQGQPTFKVHLGGRG